MQLNQFEKGLLWNRQDSPIVVLIESALQTNCFRLVSGAVWLTSVQAASGLK
jgi:hypothetical protein